MDLTQEVYLRVLRAWNSGTIENPEGYLFTVEANLVKEHAAAEARSGVAVDVSEAEFSEALIHHPIHDSALDLDARSARLREVAGQLSPKCRTAMHLKYQLQRNAGFSLEWYRPLSLTGRQFKNEFLTLLRGAVKRLAIA